MLTGAVVATAICLAIRLGRLSFDYEAKLLTRKGIEPGSMPDRRVRLITTQALMWFYGVLAVVLWVRALLEVLV